MKDKFIGEFGVYDLTVNGQECLFEERLSPVNSKLAILYCFAFMVGIILIHQMVKWCHERGHLKPIYSAFHKGRVAIGLEVR